MLELLIEDSLDILCYYYYLFVIHHKEKWILREEINRHKSQTSDFWWFNINNYHLYLTVEFSRYQLSSCHGVPSSPHMCWTNNKKCESEKNGLDQLIVLLQKHDKNIVLFPFNDKSIGVFLDALSRYYLGHFSWYIIYKNTQGSAQGVERGVQMLLIQRLYHQF